MKMVYLVVAGILSTGCVSDVPLKDIEHAEIETKKIGLKVKIARLEKELQQMKTMVANMGKEKEKLQQQILGPTTETGSRSYAGKYGHISFSYGSPEQGNTSQVQVLAIHPSDYKRVNDRLAVYEYVEESGEQGPGISEFEQPPVKTNHMHSPPGMKPIHFKKESQGMMEERRKIEAMMFPTLASRNSASGVRKEGSPSRRPIEKFALPAKHRSRFIKTSVSKKKNLKKKKRPMYTVKIAMESTAELKAMDRFMDLSGVKDRYLVDKGSLHLLFLGAYFDTESAQRRIDYIAETTGWHPVMEKI